MMSNIKKSGMITIVGRHPKNALRVWGPKTD